jgi:hypothetical protein
VPVHDYAEDARLIAEALGRLADVLRARECCAPSFAAWGIVQVAFSKSTSSQHEMRCVREQKNRPLEMSIFQMG